MRTSILTFLLDTGAVITRSKTIAAKQRITVNPATEGDTRLENAAVSTVVQSDVAIVSERSMYWEGEAPKAFGEGHNSSGVEATRLLWGLAEGRSGGPHNFDTYILLANPSASEAKVTVTYLREGGSPIVKVYTVPGTSRYNIDVKFAVPELRNASFGARIEVTNNVPIAVERSMGLGRERRVLGWRLERAGHAATVAGQRHDAAGVVASCAEAPERDRRASRAARECNRRPEPRRPARL